MSTDYGLKCVDCDATYVGDNMKKWAVDPLPEEAEAIKRFMDALDRLSHISLEVSAYWYTDDLIGFLRWIAQHSTHKLVVVDEYGKEYR